MAKKSLKKSLKNILHLTILLFLKESWLLFANVIGLIYHPFLTLRKSAKNTTCHKLPWLSLLQSFLYSPPSSPLALFT
jgi:hypothetical protein